MKTKGVMDDDPFAAEDTVVMAIYTLCDLYMRANPRITVEEAAVVAECEAGTISFTGTPDEMHCFKEVAKLVVDKYDRIRSSLASDSPSLCLVRKGMDDLKIDIVASLSSNKQCAPGSSVGESYRRIGPC